MKECDIGPRLWERAFYAVCFVVVAAVGSTIAIRAVVKMADGESIALNAFLGVLMAAVVLGGSVLMWRLAHTRLVVSGGEAFVRNILSTKRVSRSDVHQVVAGAGGKWLFLEMADGSRLPVDAISSGFVWSAARRAQRWNAELGLSTR